MDRSTTTHTQIDLAKVRHAKRFQLNLDHRPDDKSAAELRKRAGNRSPDWENYFGKRSMRLRGGFDDDWSTTDHTVMTTQEIDAEWRNWYEEMAREDMEREFGTWNKVEPQRSKRPPRGIFARSTAKTGSRPPKPVLLPAYMRKKHVELPRHLR